jgi:hypothetical protein
VGALLALVCAALPARIEAQAKWNWGLRAGFDVTKFTGDPVSQGLSGSNFQLSGQVADTRYGFTGGLFLRRQMGERFALALEALYTQKGGRGSVFGSGLIDYPGGPRQGEIDGTIDVRLDVIELPLLAEFTLPAADGVSLVPLFGVVFGFNVGASAFLTGEGRVPLPDGSTDIVSFDQGYDVSQSVDDYETSGVLGAALEFETSRGYVVLDGRWAFSLGSIDASGESFVRNSVLAFTIGIGRSLNWHGDED